MQCVYPMLKRDSALYHINDGEKPYRLVVFLDSTECMSCATGKMHGWDEFLYEVSLDGEVSCFFIFSPKKRRERKVARFAYHGAIGVSCVYRQYWYFYA